MAHTPGPWRFQQDGKEPYWGVDMPLTDGSGLWGAYNAMVYTTEADARLIAAAPELLAALRAARDDLSDLLEVADLTDEGVADTTAVLNQVIAAIAKAEGRSTDNAVS